MKLKLFFPHNDPRIPLYRSSPGTQWRKWLLMENTTRISLLLKLPDFFLPWVYAVILCPILLFFYPGFILEIFSFHCQRFWRHSSEITEAFTNKKWLWTMNGRLILEGFWMSWELWPFWMGHKSIICRKWVK